MKIGTQKGDHWVWVTAMGLGVGLLMVAGILGLIAFKGLRVFWPKKVALLQLRETATPPRLVLGEIVLRQEKRAPGQKGERETQVFQGNRDALGQAFRFIPDRDIEKTSYPSDVIRLERREYGKALGTPVALQMGDGRELSFSNPQFFPTLQKLIGLSNERWEEIQTIEKDKIGRINARMEKLRRHPNDTGSIQDLQSQYEALAAKARHLRAEQEQDHFVYRLSTGEERTLPMGQVMAYELPNQMSFAERFGKFWKNIGSFLSEDPREANTEGGVFPAIFGTLVMTILMSLAVVPFGVMGAIYLNEYARQGILVRLVRIAVNNLAGVPSIVFGVFGLGFFVYMLGGTIDSLFFSDRLPTPTFGTGGILWASLTLALMTVPVVIVSTEEALSSVSRGIREGALACGASKWQSVWRILLPASAPGILTGTILAMARGAGEVAPLMLVGVVKLAPTLPINGTFPYIHLDQKFMHLGFHIFDLGFQSPDSEAAKPMVFATTLLLIALVLVLNLAAILLRERLRKKYAAGTF